MSKLDDLIKKLCPDGVEYKTLGELGEFYGGLSGKTKKDFENGNSKFISYMNVYKNLKINIDTDEKVLIAKNEKQHCIQYGDVLFTGSSETSDECAFSSVLADKTEEKLYLNSFCFGFRFFNEKLFYPEFSKYLFRSDSLRKQLVKTASGVTRFNVSKERMKKVIIPVPPLPVQEEIVRILDKFTSLTAELEAELEARRKQYEYYRDELLTPPFVYGIEKQANLIATNAAHGKDRKSLDLSKSGCEYKKIGEICQEITNIKWKNEKSSFQYIDLTSVDRETHEIIETTKIDSSNAPSRAQQIVKENDILFGTTRPMLKRSTFISKKFDGQICSTGYCVLRPNQKVVKPRYIYHHINSSLFYQYVEIHQQGASYPAISDADVKNFTIPLPPLDVQERIVKILDRFEELVASTGSATGGIPAEIEARQKQYEYYRDKLLMFKEK